MRGLRAVLLALSAYALVVWPSVGALDCAGVALDDGCLFTITGGDTSDPNDGFAVTNADDVPLWDFVRARNLQAIGHPISQRWVNGPFTLQAFQKVILQWDPGKSRMNYYNTLDVLANRYPEVELPNVPPHQVLAADRGADFATITRNHLALLDRNAAIKARFLSEPDWLNLYGLPIRYEEREVNGNPQGLQMLRAQRTVFVIWNVPAPGTTVGRVNLQNVPDKVKKLSNVIMPDGAKAPVLPSRVAQLPVFSLGTPPAPPTSGGWIAVSAGGNHTCGIRTDGTVACWGDDRWGQATPPNGVFTALSTGFSFSCGIRSDGAVACWGSNYNGATTPPPGTFVSISSAASHTCGIRTDDTLACWGDNENGESTPPPGTFASVGGGRRFTCGLRTDGAFECWGTIDYGQLNLPPGTFSALSAGDDYICGIRQDGTVACWGAAYYGLDTPPSGAFVSISARDRHACGVRPNGAVACWGLDDHGLATPPPGAFKSVSVGRRHTCGVRSDGAMVCWRSDDGRTTPPAGTFASVSADASHACGIRTDGTVACWGAHDYGETTPPPGPFASVSVGSRRTCGLRPDGTVTCWGRGWNGEFPARASARSLHRGQRRGRAYLCRASRRDRRLLGV